MINTATIALMVAMTASPTLGIELLASYDFDEGKGTKLHDGSGNDLHGVIHGADWVSFDDGSALNFDGKDDHVVCGDRGGFGLEAPLTIEAWIKPHQLPDGEGWLIGRGPGSFLLTYSGGDYPARVYWHIGKAGKKCRARAVAHLWHHVVATFDGKLLRVYVDGSVAGGVRNWKHQGGDPGNALTIGGGRDGFAHFAGLIRSVRLYRGVLDRDTVFRRFVAQATKYRPQFTPPDPWAADGVRRLNNLVAELLQVDAGQAATQNSFDFNHPREGWVFISCDASLGDNGRLELLLNDHAQPIVSMSGSTKQPAETMRLLPKGTHQLVVRKQGSCTVNKLVVRAIPHLLFGAYPTQPQVPQYGPYTWEFLEDDVLPNVNTFVGFPASFRSQPGRMAKWRDRVKSIQRLGRRWISEHPAGWYDYETNTTSETEDEFYRLMMSKPGMIDPQMQGVLLDTHDVANIERYVVYKKAVQRVRREVPPSKKMLYFYCDSMYGGLTSEPFVETLLDSGYMLVWSNYLHERPTEPMAREAINSRLVNEVLGWHSRFPRAPSRTVVALSYLTAPYERFDIEPGVHYRKLMDMQCHTLATHPAFAGFGGVMWYKAHYAKEENLRFGGQLFRHYFIEGNTEPLCKDPYQLDHLDNPDFTDGLSGWDIAPAPEGSMKAGYLDRFGFAQARWLETGVGDHFLLARRAKAAPNQFGQTIRNLESGRTYVLELYTRDYDALINGTTKNQLHAISIDIENAHRVEEKSFSFVSPVDSYYHLGPLDDGEETPSKKSWLNYHRIVFRAGADTARLKITDWSSDQEPGGPIGQRLAFNFVQVEPYLD